MPILAVTIMVGERQGGEGGGRVAGTCSGTDLLRRLDQLSQHEEQQAGRLAGWQDSCEGVADGPGGTALQLAGPFAGLGLFS